MSERMRMHERSAKDLSGLIPELGSRKKRNFVSSADLILNAFTAVDLALATAAVGVVAKTVIDVRRDIKAREGKEGINGNEPAKGS